MKLRLSFPLAVAAACVIGACGAGEGDDTGTGGGIGTGVAAGTRGKELKIPAGTSLAITLDQALDMAVRS